MEQSLQQAAVEEDFDELEEDQVFQIGSHMPSLLAQLDASTDLLLLKDIDSTILSTNDLRSKKLQAAMDTARALERSIASQRQSAERYHAKETRLQEHNGIPIKIVYIFISPDGPVGARQTGRRVCLLGSARLGLPIAVFPLSCPGSPSLSRCSGRGRV